MVETAYSMDGNTWVALAPGHPSPWSGLPPPAGTPQNVPGYQAPTYSLDGGAAQPVQSADIHFTDADPMVSIDLSNTYTTCLTVTKVWQNGTNTGASRHRTVRRPATAGRRACGRHRCHPGRRQPEPHF